MKPVPQTVLYGEDAYGNGNCVDACLASLMELPLWMVPPFYNMWGRPDRHKRVDLWLALFGLELDFVDDLKNPGLQSPDLKNPDLTRLPKFYIVSGPSPRNNSTGHAVIFDRDTQHIAHDPHYSNQGICGPWTSIRFLKQLPGREVHQCIPLSSFMPTRV